MKPQYNYELIKDFLNGVLDSSTMNQMRELLIKDETAREIARGILILEEQFKNDLEVDLYLDRILKNRQVLIQNQLSRTMSFSYLKIAASVAVILVSAFAVYYLTRPTMEDLLAHELENPYVISTPLRNGQGSTELSDAFSAYSSGNYEKVIVHLADTSTAQTIFLRGLSFLYSGDYQAAVKEFSKKMLKNSRFEEQARWYLSVAYVKMRKWEKAKDVLNIIVNSTRHYKQEEAEKLLDFINA